jgi:hypothetical protein
MLKRKTLNPRTVRCRITVIDPPARVQFRMQRGRDGMEEPSRASADRISFDFVIRLGAPLPNGLPNFLGEFAQGTPADRFVYVNSGKRAGQPDSCWDRRAKVKLASIGSQLLQQALEVPGATLEAQIAGTAKDGGPACATVPILAQGWRLVPPA